MGLSLCVGGCPRAFTSCLLSSRHLVRTRRRLLTSPAQPECCTAPQLMGIALDCPVLKIRGSCCEAPRVPPDPFRKKGQPFPASWVPKLQGGSSPAEVEGYIHHLQQFPTPHFLFFFPPFPLCKQLQYLFYKHLTPYLCLFCPCAGSCIDTSLQFRHLSLLDVIVVVAMLIS